MVRVEGVEPSSQPWEGYIMAVIRHPLAVKGVPVKRMFCGVELNPKLEPKMRLELTTYALRKRRSTN